MAAMQAAEDEDDDFRKKKVDNKATEKKFEPGTVATEPPYSDAQLDQSYEVAITNLQALGAHARKKKIHNGPLVLRDAKPPPDRSTWVTADKQYNPYMVFSAETPVVPKSSGPPKLWLPKEMSEAKRKTKKGYKYTVSQEDLKASAKSLAARPRWDSEHHIMVGQANPEVQKFVREYFDKPIRKESEGIPKVKELYAMNDRQMGWWDEASPLGEPKHTYLDNCLPWNVGGPKQAQKPSYWRKVAEKGSASAPSLKTPDPKKPAEAAKPNTESRSHLTLVQRMADMPPAQAQQFWREWVDQSKKRLPPAPEEKAKVERTKKKKGTRGGWKDPDAAQTAAARAAEQVAAEQAKPEPQLAATAPPIYPRPENVGNEEWDNRWNVCMSKDNRDLASCHRQYFTSAQFLSGFEAGHPGAYLGLESQRWRAVAKNVTLAPTGAAGRGPVGRRCLLI